MRYRKWIIALFTVLLLGLTALAFTQEDKAAEMDLSVYVSVLSEAGEEKLVLWQHPEGGYYVFLPGYADMEQVTLFCEDTEIHIGSIPVKGSISCGEWSVDTEYSFFVSADGVNLQSTIVFVQSGGVPSLYIDTQSGGMEFIHLDKTNQETGAMRLYGTEGELLYSGDVSSIKGRGNTSWGAEKKPYNLTLAQEADLLGMGAAQRWVLLAEGHNLLNIRNKIVYDFANAVGMPYSPDCEWVDLYLNGEYAGLYLLSERNEIHTERIAVSQQGSFVVSQEYESRLQEQKYPYVITESGQALRIRYTDADAAQLQQRWQSVENAILSEDGLDPVSGKHWTELINLDSWAGKYLIEEIFGNLDAGSLSQYFYCDGSDPEGTIYAGPVWDYDFAMGGESVWLKPYTDYFTMNRMYVNEDVYTPWFPALYEKDEFYNRVKELYEQAFLPLLQELTDSRIPAYFEQIHSAAQMDGIRRGLEWEEIRRESEYIISFMEARIEFLTDLWMNGTVYHTVYADPGRYGIYGCFVVKDGDVLPELPAAEKLGGLGWYDLETDEPFDITGPIEENVRIYVKKPETQLPKIHFLPVLAVILLLPVLLACDKLQTKMNGRGRNDSAKVNEIPS